MPRYSKKTVDLHREKVRRILIMKGNATIFEVQEMMNKTDNLNLDKNYVAKLINEIQDERSRRFNSYTVNKVLAKFQDLMSQSDVKLWTIINSSNSTYNEKTQALREIRINNRELFDKMFDAGVFKKNIGELNITEQHTLEDINKLPKDKQKEIYDKIIGIKRLLGRPAKPDRKK